jgi:hypothetical protein
MDRGAAVAGDPSSEYAKIGQEFMEFLDTGRSAGWSRIVLKSVVDATVFNLPTT